MRLKAYTTNKKYMRFLMIYLLMEKLRVDVM